MATEAQNPPAGDAAREGAAAAGASASAGPAPDEPTAHAGEGEHDEHEAHASVGFYWMIGGILAILTAMEVAAFYMELGAFEAPFLLLLSAAKFALVVMFFMHLKFDSKVFTGVFLAGLVLAAFMVTALILLYHVLPTYV